MNESLDYKTYLRELLNEKIQQNSRYSLRAFARDLGVSPSILSETISGKHGLSEAVAKRIAKNVGLNKNETQFFCDQVVSQNSKSIKKKNEAARRIKSIKEMSKQNSLQMDHFKIISDWYHFAILELTYLNDFKNDENWIARKVGISKFEVQAAIERLLKLELLEVINGRLSATEDYTASPDGIPSDAIKKFQRQLIEKAQTALALQSVDNRDITSLIVSVDKSRIPEVKKEIKNFRRHINAHYGTDEKRDSVYCLAIQLFELTENINNN